MSANIPKAAAEAAAKGLAVHKWPTAIGVWESFGQGMQDDFLDQARAALEAAAPHLLALARKQQAAIEAALALAEEWRYKGEFGWGAWQEGHGPDPEGYALDGASADLRAAITDALEATP
ncbi:hypothetical protein AHiyo6_04090 [Arthrobacter sp. Hiyo6]|nr:hypothetical protein AHiyo6_04090 [Arthrobacter sp. Hiyo6]